MVVVYTVNSKHCTCTVSKVQREVYSLHQTIYTVLNTLDSTSSTFWSFLWTISGNQSTEYSELVC